MPTKKQTISVRLDDVTKRRIEHAARLSRQSSGAFLEEAGEGRAREVLLDWALMRHRAGEASFSELAEETGFAVEEIMRAASGSKEDQLATLDAFVASCRALAESQQHPEFARAAEEAARQVREDIVHGRL